MDTLFFLRLSSPLLQILHLFLCFSVFIFYDSCLLFLILVFFHLLGLFPSSPLSCVSATFTQFPVISEVLVS